MTEEKLNPASAALAALHDAELYKNLLDQVGDGVYVVDRERRILYWNAGAERITGYREHEVVSRTCHSGLLMHCDGSGTVICGGGCPLAQVMDDGVARDCKVFLRHKQGHRLPVTVRSLAIRGAGGEIVGAIELFQVTAASRDERGALHAFGCMDDLTGLPNRAYGELLAEQALAARARFEVPFGWIRFELDAPEQLAHRYGHGVLAAVLLLIARTLAANLGPYDILAYWGDAQFRVGTHYASQEDLEEFARLLAVLVGVSGVEWWGDPVSVTLSVGVAAAESGDSLAALERRAAKTIFARTN
jgi:diguanylate cyclase (GGDEF)-like protein/PAS domain S-box-containing protein